MTAPLIVQPGNYSVTESIPAEWNLISSDCLVNGVPQNTTLNFNATLGDSVECIFENEFVPFIDPFVIDLDADLFDDKIWPSAIDVDNDGNIYIAATQYPNPFNPDAPFNDPVTKIMKLDPNGDEIFTLPDTFNKNFFQGPASNSGDIAVNGTGHIFVTDSQLDKVRVYDPSGSSFTFLPALGFNPNSIAIDSSNRVFVSAEFNVISLDSTGNVLQNHSLPDRGNIGVDDSGNFWLFDNAAKRKYDISGNLLVSTSDFNTRHTEVSGFAINSTGHIIDADLDDRRIQIFDPLGNHIKNIGVPGDGIGEFAVHLPNPFNVHTNGPHDVAIDSIDNIYFADRGNNRIVVVPPNYAESDFTETSV